MFLSRHQNALEYNRILRFHALNHGTIVKETVVESLNVVVLMIDASQSMHSIFHECNVELEGILQTF